MLESTKPPMRQDNYYVVSNPQAGETTLSLRVLFSGHSQTRPGHKPGPKVVDYYLLHHVLSGYGTYACLGQTYTLGPGDSFLIEPGALVHYVADEENPWRYGWIAFDGDEAQRRLADIGLSSERPVVSTGGDRGVAALFRRIQQAFRSRRAGASLEASGALLLLLGRYAEALAGPENGTAPAAADVDRTVQQAIHYLTAQYAEPITIELMAETLGYNRAYLSTLFKKHTGVTPVTFLLKLRLDRARHLLRERPELTVEQIASSVGFQDPLHFSKQFRKQYLASPTEYRLSLR